MQTCSSYSTNFPGPLPFSPVFCPYILELRQLGVHPLIGTFRVENQGRFEAVLKIVFEPVLEVRGTPKTVFSFDIPRFRTFSSRFRVLDW